MTGLECSHEYATAPCLPRAGTRSWHDSSMQSYRVEAVVLRTHRLGEADRIITLLTRERGKVRAVAKGVRRTRSRFGSRLEPLTRADLLIAPGKNLDIITQAETLQSYGSDLVLDYPRWTIAQTMLETADRLVSEEYVQNESQYLLLVGGLKSLVESEHEASLVLNAYLLRALSIAGYTPIFDECVVCGVSGAQPFFNVASGGAVCASHRPPGSVAPKPDTIGLMSALLTGDWVSADAAPPANVNEANGIVVAYTQWHLERGLRSIAIVERQ